MKTSTISQDKELWSDITILDNPENSYLLCNIRCCSETITNAYNLFYTIMELNELSERALALTEEVLDYNGSNYTVWWYRRRCLPSLWTGKHILHLNNTKRDTLISELEFTREWCKKNPKSYQAWFHRRWIIVELAEPLDELSSLECALLNDPKNMNIWTHRQFISQEYELKLCHDTNNHSSTITASLLQENYPNKCRPCRRCWYRDEFAFSAKMINLDFRNNSAWSFRRSIVEYLAATLTEKEESNKFLQEVQKDDIMFCIDWCKKAPHNESSWNVLQSYFLSESDILQSLHSNTSDIVYKKKKKDIKPLPWIAPQFYNQILHLVHHVLEEDCTNRFAMYVQYLYCLSENNLKKCNEILLELGQVDYIRNTYWEDRRYRLNHLTIS